MSWAFPFDFLLTFTSYSLPFLLYDLAVVVPSFLVTGLSAVLDLQSSILSIHIPQRDCELGSDAVLGVIRLALESLAWALESFSL